MVDRKNARMNRFRDELDAEGIQYRPIAFSCFGRPHADAVRVLRALAKQHARRKRSEAHVEYRRLLSRITTEIWRRAARMVRQCCPEAVDEEDDADDDSGFDPAQFVRHGHPGTVELGLLQEGHNAPTPPV
jgi:hypothetical protein